MEVDPIEQYAETSSPNPADPIKQFTEEGRQAPASSSSASVMPHAQCIDGTDPDSEAGRVKKQQRRLYEDATTQEILEVLAFKRASERVGLSQLRLQFPNSSDSELTGEDVDDDGLPVTLEPTGLRSSTRPTGRTPRQLPRLYLLRQAVPDLLSSLDQPRWPR